MKKYIYTLILILFLNVAAVAADVSYADSEKARGEYQRGIKLTREKSYDAAIEAFKSAIKYNPSMGDAYYNIAAILVSLGKYDDAYNYYVKAIALNPEDYESIVQAAKISYNKKNYALAMKYLKYVPASAPQYPFAQQLNNDAKEMFEMQSQKTERAKITAAVPSKKVLIDNFKSPAGIVIDTEGNMYVACYSDNAVVKYDKNKIKTNFVKDYLLDGPIGLAIDKYDNIYIANFDANNILKVTKGGNVSIFMDNISKPYFLYIKNDVLYVSEQGNDAVVTYNLGK